MAILLYRLFIQLYPFIVNLVSPFNHKAKLWVSGRKGVLEEMRKAIDPVHPLIWIHCSSLGEFEQGRPLIEKIRTMYPTYKILVTFFSPSGYEVRKNYEGADYVFYLPMDNERNAFEFMEIAKPKLILFVKYEFWYYYLHEAQKRSIPLLLVSGIFRNNQPFFSKYGSFHRSLLSCFSHIFVQNEESKVLLAKINFNKNVTTSGDTRFDRVIEIAEQFQPIAFAEEFCIGSEVIVAGSTWSEDDKILAKYINAKSNVKCIIAPHEISKQRIAECSVLYKDSTLFSALDTLPPSLNITTVIVDNVGMLSRLYKYSTVSFVGGGFGAQGVHNVLEAAVYGKPVIFGPVYEKYFEAIELVDNGGAISVNSALALASAFDNLLKKDENYIQSCNASANYVYRKRGATEAVLQFIQEKRLLTN